jgi:hypothetical protein
MAAALQAQLRQFARVRANCQAMTAGTQLLLWREDGFHLRFVRMSADLQHVLWEDVSGEPAGHGGVRVSELVDVLPSALSARLQTRTALALSMSLVTNDGCFDFLALAQEDWDVWYEGLRFLAETSEPQLQPLPQQRGALGGEGEKGAWGDHRGAFGDGLSEEEEQEEAAAAAAGLQQQRFGPAVPAAAAAAAAAAPAAAPPPAAAAPAAPAAAPAKYGGSAASAAAVDAMPLLQEIRDRMVQMQREQNELARCHQQALMMLAQAQVAHADGGGGGAGGAGGGGVSRQPWGREPDGESDESDAEVGAQRQQGEEGLNKTAQSSARSDVHLRSRERVLMLSRLRELEHLTELKDTTIETLERLIAEVV